MKKLGIKPLITLLALLLCIECSCGGYQSGFVNRDERWRLRRRGSRGLSAFDQQTQSNTGEVLIRLKNVASELSDVSSGLGRLAALKDSSSSDKLAKLDSNSNQVNDGSSIVANFQSAGSKFSEIPYASSNGSNPNSLPSELSSSSELLSSRLNTSKNSVGSSEGYETSTGIPTDFPCIADRECFGNFSSSAPFCNSGRCSSSCLTIQQCTDTWPGFDLVCEWGVCMEIFPKPPLVQCSVDANCTGIKTGPFCFEGVCSYHCLEDGQCVGQYGGSATCLSNYCVFDEPTPPVFTYPTLNVTDSSVGTIASPTACFEDLECRRSTEGPFCTGGTCSFQCTSDDQCVELVGENAFCTGYFCAVRPIDPLPPVGLTCVEDSDCSNLVYGLLCTNGSCSSQCVSDDQCAGLYGANAYCSDDFCTMHPIDPLPPVDLTCVNDSDCINSESFPFCINFTCSKQCVSDNQCIELYGQNAICNFDFCVMYTIDPLPPSNPSCSNDSDCSGSEYGSFCTNGTCSFYCSDDIQCTAVYGENSVCYKMFCTKGDATYTTTTSAAPTCFQDSECYALENGPFCIDGICTQQCLTSSQCNAYYGGNMWCYDGKCVVVDPTIPPPPDTIPTTEYNSLPLPVTCSEDSECKTSESGPLCNNGTCGFFCSSDEQCMNLYGPQAVCAGNGCAIVDPPPPFFPMNCTSAADCKLVAEGPFCTDGRCSPVCANSTQCIEMFGDGYYCGEGFCLLESEDCVLDSTSPEKFSEQ